MKIIIVANTDWYLFNFRLSLARYLRSHNHDVVFCSPLGQYARKLENEGFRWVQWEVTRSTFAPWQEVRALLRLTAIYRRERPSLVHHHTIKPVLYGSFASRLAGVPAVVNSIAGRGYVFHPHRGCISIVLRVAVSATYRLALAVSRSVLICENEGDRQFFVRRRFLAERRTTLIEGVGVDTDVFSPEPEPDGVPVVLMAGRLLWDKGAGVFVDAGKYLRDRLDVRMVLVGEPDPGNPSSVDVAVLRRWESEGLVEWLGWSPDMPTVLNRSSVVVLPTLYEGVPTVLLEAAACGRPIVTTDIPGCRAAVIDGETGILIPPNDPVALAHAIERLLRDPQLRRAMGNAGRDLILQKYTHARVNEETLRVYRSTSAEGGSAYL